MTITIRDSDAVPITPAEITEKSLQVYRSAINQLKNKSEDFSRKAVIYAEASKNCQDQANELQKLLEHAETIMATYKPEAQPCSTSQESGANG